VNGIRLLPKHIHDESRGALRLCVDPLLNSEFMVAMAAHGLPLCSAWDVGLGGCRRGRSPDAGRGDPAGRGPGSYHVTRHTTEPGLPQNTIRALLQTRDGYLRVGTRIEVPRGALTAEFFSFGTNDLTQTRLGMNRDAQPLRKWSRRAGSLGFCRPWSRASVARGARWR